MRFDTIICLAIHSLIAGILYQMEIPLSGSFLPRPPLFLVYVSEPVSVRPMT
jgi:hypothetical protein